MISGYDGTSMLNTEVWIMVDGVDYECPVSTAVLGAKHKRSRESNMFQSSGREILTRMAAIATMADAISHPGLDIS